MFDETINYHGFNIWVKPVCDFFKIDVRNQHKKIKNDPILTKLVEKNTPVLGEIDKNGRILLTKKGFLRWIQIINPNIIPENMRSNFILYQEMVADFLFGSIEEHLELKNLNIRVQKLKKLRGKIGIEIQTCQNELTNALNHRYQYKIDFKQNESLVQ